MYKASWIHDEDLADILEKCYSDDLAGDFMCVLSDIPENFYDEQILAVNNLFMENDLNLRAVNVRNSKDGTYYEWKLKL